jgi:hypothetical protein
VPSTMRTTTPSPHSRLVTCISASEIPIPPTPKPSSSLPARSFRDAIADLHHTFLHLWEVDDGTVIATIDVYYKRLDGRELTLPCCNIFRVNNGRVDRYLIYMDVNPVLASTGSGWCRYVFTTASRSSVGDLAGCARELAPPVGTSAMGEMPTLALPVANPTPGVRLARPTRLGSVPRRDPGMPVSVWSARAHTTGRRPPDCWLVQMS